METGTPLKKLRERYMPKHTKLKHPDGSVATSQERPEILADFFEQMQWGNKISKDEKEATKKRMGSAYNNDLLYNECANIRTDPFDMNELDTVIKLLKRNKSPGTDGLPAEFLKFLDHGSRSLVLQEINAMQKHDTWPEALDRAFIVTIYKKGKVDNPENYRPIALLNAMYKI